MEVKEMKELIAAVSSANVDEFEYNNEEFSIRIAKKKAKIATVDASVAGVPVQSAAIMPEQNEEQPEELLYGCGSTCVCGGICRRFVSNGSGRLPVMTGRFSSFFSSTGTAGINSL